MMNIDEIINPYFSELVEKYNGIQIFLSNEEGNLLYQSKANYFNAKSPLISGLWQASNKINTHEENIVQVSSTQTGYYITSLGKNKPVIIALEYRRIQNPAKLKYEFKRMIREILENENLDVLFQSKVSHFLFDHLEDEEIEHMFKGLEN